MNVAVSMWINKYVCLILSLFIPILCYFPLFKSILNFTLISKIFYEIKYNMSSIFHFSKKHKAQKQKATLKLQNTERR